MSRKSRPGNRHDRSESPADSGQPVLSAGAAADVRAFLDLLGSAEERQHADLRCCISGSALRVALNELDLHQHLACRQARAVLELGGQAEIIAMGLTRVVTLMLRLHVAFTLPAMTARRDPVRTGPVLAMAWQLGQIEQGRRLVEQVWAGMIRIQRISPEHFDFLLPRQLIDARADERDVEERFWREAGRRRLAEMASEQAQQRSAEVRQLMQENVYVWRDHFIGYNADRLVDEDHMEEAWDWVKRSPQADAFDPACLFGGICFLSWMIAAAFLISLCRKHELFCEVLVEREPEIRIEDILTVSASRDDIVESLFRAVNDFGAGFDNHVAITLDDAVRIYEVVALTRRNAGLVDKPSPPFPVVIEYCDTGVVMFVAGQYRQMEFLLDSLRAACPRDYSSGQRRREPMMQRALRSLLARHHPNIALEGNIRLRLCGRELTDVDFVAHDPEFGDLILFQLKYQDHHGPDVRAQSSRMARLLRESLKWLASTDQWLAATSPASLRSAFRLPARASVTRIRKVIIGRHHAHVLAAASLDEDTAFASWPQLVNAVLVMQSRQGNLRTLNGLFRTLRTNVVEGRPRHSEDSEDSEDMMFKLPGVEFHLRRSVSSSPERHAE